MANNKQLKKNEINEIATIIAHELVDGFKFNGGMFATASYKQTQAAIQNYFEKNKNKGTGYLTQLNTIQAKISETMREILASEEHRKKTRVLGEQITGIISLFEYGNIACNQYGDPILNPQQRIENNFKFYPNARKPANIYVPVVKVYYDEEGKRLSSSDKNKHSVRVLFSKYVYGYDRIETALSVAATKAKMIHEGILSEDMNDHIGIVCVSTYDIYRDIFTTKGMVLSSGGTVAPVGMYYFDEFGIMMMGNALFVRSILKERLVKLLDGDEFIINNDVFYSNKVFDKHDITKVCEIGQFDHNDATMSFYENLLERKDIRFEYENGKAYLTDVNPDIIKMPLFSFNHVELDYRELETERITIDLNGAKVPFDLNLAIHGMPCDLSSTILIKVNAEKLNIANQEVYTQVVNKSVETVLNTLKNIKRDAKDYPYYKVKDAFLKPMDKEHIYIFLHKYSNNTPAYSINDLRTYLNGSLREVRKHVEGFLNGNSYYIDKYKSGEFYSYIVGLDISKGGFVLTDLMALNNTPFIAKDFEQVLRSYGGYLRFDNIQVEMVYNRGVPLLRWSKVKPETNEAFESCFYGSFYGDLHSDKLLINSPKHENSNYVEEMAKRPMFVKAKVNDDESIVSLWGDCLLLSVEEGKTKLMELLPAVMLASNPKIVPEGGVALFRDDLPPMIIPNEINLAGTFFLEVSDQVEVKQLGLKEFILKEAYHLASTFHTGDEIHAISPYDVKNLLTKAE